MRAAYLAHAGQEAVLAEELGRLGVAVSGWHGLLALSPDPPADARWALDRWLDPEIAPIASIGEAASLLRGRQRNWSHLPLLHHRRSALIADRLPPVKAAPLHFPAAAPTAPLGAWTLLSPDRLLFSTRKSSPFPNGECRLVENRTGPPSRAYLKLWETLALLAEWPRPGERCLELGASPGGWTWALASLGASVTAVDRSPLASAVAAMPGVEMRQGNAFTLRPEDVEPLDWLFSDVIAYPDRLLDMARTWIDSGRVRRLICTVKFQRPTAHEVSERFASIPGGTLRHGSHNGHELMFVWCRPGDSVPHG
ncbi:SAM-dependent methyltransferase [Rhizosaccharibacter radicis]|uniref:SAM-dependent methyltransferase n=1 Tax=Rhizosaccharibacter radicis TaxID=2782605 RepID=UPI003BF544E5